MSATSIPSWDEDAPVPAPRWLTPPRIGSWLAGNLVAERGRWALWLPAFMGAGIGAYFWLTAEPPIWLAPTGLLLGICGVVAAWWRWPAALIPAAAVAVAIFGFGLAQFQTWMVAAPVIGHRIGPAEIVGRLVSVDPLPNGTRIVLAPRSIQRMTPQRTPFRVRVRLRGTPPDLIPGEWVSLRAMLLPPPGPAMPGAYDFQRRAWFDRLGAVGFAIGAPQRIAAPAGERLGGLRS
jgi:competence protein ComEC